MKMKENLHLFDTSDYPKDDSRGLYSTVNKKVLGVMKDEMNGSIAESFVGLRAKMYSLKVQGDGETNKAKGIKTNFVKKNLKHDDYLNTLKTRKMTRATFNAFRSKKLRLSTVEINKACLSAFDNKRFILPDGISTLSYGHKDIGTVYN